MTIRDRAPLILLVMLNAAAVTDRMVLGALAPVLQPALGLSDAGLGLVQGPAFGLAYGLAIPFAGRIVDAVGAGRALVGAVLVWTLGLIVSASAASLTPLVVGRAITGIGQAALIPAGLSLILATVAPVRAGRTIGLFTGAGTLGRGIAFALGGALLGLFGTGRATALLPVEPWSAVLLTLATGNLLLLALLAWRGIGVAATTSVPDAYAAVWRWLRAGPGPIAAVVGAALGAVVVVQAVAAWIAVVLVRAFAVPPAAAAGAIGAIGLVAGPLGAVLGGVLADRTTRIGRAQMLVALPCIPAILLVVRADTLGQAYAGLAATLLLSGAGATIGLVRFQWLTPVEARGSANGLFMALTSLVGIAGAPFLVAIVPLAAIGDRLAGVVVGATLVSALAAVAARD